MVYNRYEDTLTIDYFEEWLEESNQTHGIALEDLLPDIYASGITEGLHEYNGISTDWRFTHTGRGYF